MRRHARIVAASHDEHGFGDLVRVIERRDFFEKLADLRIALVTVLHAAQIAAVRGRPLEKAHEVGNAHHVHGAADPAVEMERRGQRHVAAITAAGDQDALGIEPRVAGNPVKQRADVLHRVLALESVIERQKRLAIAR